PPSGASRTNGLVNGSALVGIAATPLAFGWLIDRFEWPAAFLIAALATAALGLVWTALVPDKSPTHRDWSAFRVAGGAESLAALFTHRGLLLLTLSYGAVGYFQYLFFYWMAYYFETVLKLPESTSRTYAAVPALAMAVGMPLGGWLSDRLEQALGARLGR